MRWTIVGNPENRRVSDFQAAAEAMGLARPECVAWQSLLNNVDAILPLLSQTDGIRIESPGENDDVLHQLIQLGIQEKSQLSGIAGDFGLADDRLAFAEIRSLDLQYGGFTKVLHQLSGLPVRFMNHPADVAVMFDKWASHKRFVSNDIAVPKTVRAAIEFADLPAVRQHFGGQRSGRMFLKPRYASSASGVCAYRWSGDRHQLIAPIEIHGTGDSVRLFNSLKIRRYTSLFQIQQILSRLMPQGMIAQQWISKKQLPAGNVDLRILVVAGKARHWVVRQSHHPMTNLHLGNRRADRDQMRSECGDEIMGSSFRLAERAAACFPDSLYAGVDVMIPQKGSPLVCEINAFGDLLPGVMDQNESAYEAILSKANCRADFQSV